MAGNDELEQRLEMISTLIDNKKYSFAEREIRLVLEIQPESVEVQKLCLRLRVGQQRYSEGLEIAQTLQAKDPSDTNVRFYLAVCMEYTGKPSVAVDIWRGLIKENPNSALYYACLADTIFWQPRLNIPQDEVEVNVKQALKLDPNLRLAKYLEFWVAHRAKDVARMQTVVAEAQKMFPGESIAAELLSRFIREYKREDSAVIAQLLNVFPESPELLQLAKDAYETRQWFEMIGENIFKIFTLEPKPWATAAGLSSNYLNYPKQLLKVAQEEAPGFAVKKLARVLLNLPKEEVPALVNLLIDLCAEDTTKKQCLPGYLTELLRGLAPEDLNRFTKKIFAKKFVELYHTILVEITAKPSEETWDEIWSQVSERPQLLNDVLERCYQYNPRPPVSIDLFFEKSGQVRKPMLSVTRHLLKEDPSLVRALWRMWGEKANSLPKDMRDEFFAVICSGSRTELLAAPGFAQSLVDFLDDPKNFDLPLFSSLWDGLSYMPETFLKKLADDPGYPKLIKKAFSVVLLSKKPEPQARLALFLYRVPWLEPDFRANQQAVEKLREECFDPTALQLVSDLANRISQQIAKSEPKKQEPAKQAPVDLAEKNTEALVMKGQVAVLQAEFAAKMAEIQTSQQSPAEKAKALKAAVEEFEKSIKATVSTAS